MTDNSSTIIRFSNSGSDSGNSRGTPPRQTVFFTRPEFDAILNLYGKMVASGHWKDYAIDSLSDKAVFSVYRNRHETALYQITKSPKLAAKQGAFCIISPQGKILKRGHEIDQLLKYFNKLLIKLVK